MLPVLFLLLVASCCRLSVSVSVFEYPPTQEKGELFNIAVFLPLSDGSRASEVTGKASAAAFAADAVNNDYENFPNVSLHVTFVDTYSDDDPELALVDAAEYIVQQTNTTGCIGPDLYEEIMVMAPILQDATLPYISLFAPHKQLADSETYPFLLRVAPSHRSLSAAVVDFCKHYGFKAVDIVYSLDDYGQSAYEEFLFESQQSKVVVSREMPLDSSESWAPQLRTLSTSPSAAVVLVGTASQVFFQTATALEWVGSTARTVIAMEPVVDWVRMTEMSEDDSRYMAGHAASHVIVVRPGTDPTRAESLVEVLDFASSTDDPDSGYGELVDMSYMFDAVQVYSYAIQASLDTGQDPSNGHYLNRRMHVTDFDGISGPVSFYTSADRRENIIHYVQANITSENDKVRVVGNWTEGDGLRITEEPIFSDYCLRKTGLLRHWDNSSNSYHRVQDFGEVPQGRHSFYGGYNPATEEAYVFGGKDATGDLDSTYRFNFGSSSWSVVRDSGYIPSPRFLGCGGVGHNYFMIFGGQNPAFTNEVYMLDLATWSWINATPPPSAAQPSARNYISCTVRHGRLVMYGGGTSIQDANHDLWEFDPMSQTWEQILPEKEGDMWEPYDRTAYGIVATPTGDRVYIQGGTVDWLLAEGNTFYYDYTERAWFDLPMHDGFGSKFLSRTLHGIVFARNQLIMSFGYDLIVQDSIVVSMAINVDCPGPSCGQWRFLTSGKAWLDEILPNFETPASLFPSTWTPPELPSTFTSSDINDIPISVPNWSSFFADLLAEIASSSVYETTASLEETTEETTGEGPTATGGRRRILSFPVDPRDLSSVGTMESFSPSSLPAGVVSYIHAAMMQEVFWNMQSEDRVGEGQESVNDVSGHLRQQVLDKRRLRRNTRLQRATQQAPFRVGSGSPFSDTHPGRTTLGQQRRYSDGYDSTKGTRGISDDYDPTKETRGISDDFPLGLRNDYVSGKKTRGVEENMSVVTRGAVTGRDSSLNSGVGRMLKRASEATTDEGGSSVEEDTADVTDSAFESTSVPFSPSFSGSLYTIINEVVEDLLVNGSYWLQPRDSLFSVERHDEVYYLCGWGVIEYLNEVTVLRVSANESVSSDLSVVHEHYNTPLPRAYHCMSLIADTIVLFGGATSIGLDNNLWTYNLTTLEWTNVQPSGDVPEVRQKATMIQTGDRLILFGGLGSSGTTLSDLWQYSATQQSWLQLFPSGLSPQGRYEHSATSINAIKFVVFGGRRLGTSLYDMWTFDNLLQQWEEIEFTQDSSEIPRATRHGVMAYYDGQILYAGGLTETAYPSSEIWIFYWEDRLWERIETSLYSELFAPAFAQFGPIVMAHGGGYWDELLDVLFIIRINGTSTSTQWIPYDLSDYIPLTRKGHTGVAVGSDFYIYGGVPSYNSVMLEMANFYLGDMHLWRNGPIHADCESEDELCWGCAIGTYVDCSLNDLGRETCQCLACPQGQYADPTEDEPCTECPPGFYSVNVGANSVFYCFPCPAGSYSSEPGASECTPCPEDMTCSLASYRPLASSTTHSNVEFTLDQPDLLESKAKEIGNYAEEMYFYGFLLMLALTAGCVLAAHNLTFQTFLADLDFFFTGKHGAVSRCGGVKEIQMPIGGYYTIIYGVLTTLVIGVLIMQFGMDNTYEIRTLEPNLSLNRGSEDEIVVTANVTAQIIFQNFGAACVNETLESDEATSFMNCDSTIVVTTDLVGYPKTPQCRRDLDDNGTPSCLIKFYCQACSIESELGQISFAAASKEAFASDISFLVSASGAYPDKFSTVEGNVSSDSHEMFRGLDPPSEIRLEVIQTTYEQAYNGIFQTGWHFDFIEVAKGAQTDSVNFPYRTGVGVSIQMYRQSYMLKVLRRYNQTITDWISNMFGVISGVLSIVTLILVTHKKMNKRLLALTKRFQYSWVRRVLTVYEPVEDDISECERRRSMSLVSDGSTQKPPTSPGPFLSRPEKMTSGLTNGSPQDGSRKSSLNGSSQDGGGETISYTINGLRSAPCSPVMHGRYARDHTVQPLSRWSLSHSPPVRENMDTLSLSSRAAREGEARKVSVIQI